MTIQIKEVVDDIDETLKGAFKEGGMRKSVETEFQTMTELTLDAIKKQDRKLRQMDRKIEELAVLMNELLNRTALDPNRLANLPPPSALSRSFEPAKSPDNENITTGEGQALMERNKKRSSKKRTPKS